MVAPGSPRAAGHDADRRDAQRAAGFEVFNQVRIARWPVAAAIRRELKQRELVLRGLSYYWRTNAAVVLGVATAVAVLAGALLVGDSVRGSLRDLVVQRLGLTDRVVASPGFFREALADDLRTDDTFASSFASICPMIAVQGLVTDQTSGRRAAHVQVYG